MWLVVALLAHAADPPTAADLYGVAWSEPDPDRRGALLIAAATRAFEERSATCVDPHTEACRDAVGIRLTLFHTQAVREAHAHPERRITVPFACAPGVDVNACVAAAFEGDWFGWNHHTMDGRVEFASARRVDDDRVWVLVGEATLDAAGRVDALTLLADEVVSEPRLASLPHGVWDGMVGAAEPLERDGWVRLGSGRILRLDRPLRTDETIAVVCGDRVRRLPAPRLHHVAVAAHDNVFQGGVQPAYVYALPCDAALLFSGSVEGVREGRVVSVELGPKVDLGRTTVVGDVTIAESGGAGCTVERPGASLAVEARCDLEFVGDLNGDGVADVVIRHRGEMGCGGRSLYLSDETGWQRAAESGWFC